jgi:hypothetical protein
MQQGNPQDQQTPSERRIIIHTVQSHRSYRMRRVKWFHFFPPGTTLVHISAGLSTEGTCPIINSHGSRLTYCMIENRVWLLLQYILWPMGVVNNTHIVPIHICGANQGHTHHSQLLAEATTGINPIIHWYILRSKDTWLHSWLTLGAPHNWRHIHVYDKPSNWIGHQHDHNQQTSSDQPTLHGKQEHQKESCHSHHHTWTSNQSWWRHPCQQRGKWDQTQLLRCDVSPGMQTDGRKVPGGLHAAIKGN